jgi:hypothetical protein
VASPFDVRALRGRTFRSVLDEIAPGPWIWGFTEDGPDTVETLISFAGGPPRSEEEIAAEAARDRKFAEIKSRLAPILAAFRNRTVTLVDISGAEIPLWVWFSGRWRFYRDDKRQVEWLEALTETGQKIEYYNPTFAGPAAKGRGDKRLARSGKRGGGNTQYDDAAAVARAKAVYKAMTKKSKRRAANTVIAELRADGHKIDGASLDAWTTRIRRQI